MISPSTPYKYIYKNKNYKTKSGLTYIFRLPDKNNRQIFIKSNVDINKLVKFRDNYLNHLIMSPQGVSINK